MTGRRTGGYQLWRALARGLGLVRDLGRPRARIYHSTILQVWHPRNMICEFNMSSFLLQAWGLDQCATTTRWEIDWED